MSDTPTTIAGFMSVFVLIVLIVILILSVQWLVLPWILIAKFNAILKSLDRLEKTSRSVQHNTAIIGELGGAKPVPPTTEL